MLKKITTIFKLLRNVIFRHEHYSLTFVKENGNWFYDFKNWGFSHDNLMMVAGADDLCEMYSGGNDRFTINIIASRIPLEKLTETHTEFKGEEWPDDFSFSDRILYGRSYESSESDMWICPVTLFVLGRYPNYIYIEKHES